MPRNVLVSVDVTNHWFDPMMENYLNPVPGVDSRAEEIVEVPTDWFVGDEFDRRRTRDLLRLAFGDRYYYTEFGDAFDALTADTSKGWIVGPVRVAAL